MSQFNYAPVATYFGDLQVDSAGSDAKSVARRSDISGLSYISSIAVGSQSMLTVTNGELAVDSLLITDVTVDTTYTTLAAWIANGIPAGFKTGDILVLTAANPSLTYICKVASPTQASDFAHLNDGNAYSAGNGITLAGSVFSADVSWLRTSGNLFAAGNGLTLDGSGNFAADAAWLRTDSNVFTAGTGITNSAGTLAISLVAGTGVSVSGNTITGNYIAGNGLALSGNSFAADAAWLRTDGNVFTVGTGITNSAGTLAVSLVAGTGISVSGNTITGNYVAGTGVAITGNSIAGNYVAGTGVAISGNSIATDMSKFRFSASNVSLTANQSYTVTHNLGYKLVQFTALRTSDSSKVELEVIYSSTSALTIIAVSNLTIDLAVSI
jgi:hypothetical protein